eukprot:8056-Amphidinium_carterae.1
MSEKDGLKQQRPQAFDDLESAPAKGQRALLAITRNPSQRGEGPKHINTSIEHKSKRSPRNPAKG